MGCVETTNKKNDINNRNTNTIVLIDEWIQIPPIASEESIVYYKGKIKNIGDKTLDKVDVIVIFFDNNNTVLFSKIDTVDNLGIDQEKVFQVMVTNYNQYFQEIDHVEYEFKI
jgi:hypothetical protein